MYVNKIFWGKLTMLFLALYINATIMGIALAIAIGHIFDIRYHHLKYYFQKKLAAQKPSENFIFLLAYYSYVLGLSTSKTSAALMKLISTKDPEAVAALFVYYLTKYIPKNFNNLSLMDKKLQESIKSLESSSAAEDKLRFFILIEELFDCQTSYASMADISILKKIAKSLNVKYNRDYQAQTTSHTSSKNEYTNTKQSDESESVGSTKSAISQEIKSAFKELGFSAENPPNLTELKREYRAKVRKYHPDILKGRGETEKKLKQAEEKLSKLNKSMDIAKNFLANN